MRALKGQHRSGLSGSDQAYVEGFASLVPEIETAREAVHAASLADS
jgi:hypothetical protein